MKTTLVILLYIKRALKKAFDCSLLRDVSRRLKNVDDDVSDKTTLNAVQCIVKSVCVNRCKK